MCWVGMRVTAERGGGGERFALNGKEEGGGGQFLFFFSPSNKEEEKRISFPLGEENEEKESPSCSKFLLFSDS